MTLDATILGYVNDGMAYSRIAEITGRTRNAIAGAVWRLRNPEHKAGVQPQAPGSGQTQTHAKPQARTRGWARPCFDKKEVDLPPAPTEPVLVPIWELQGFHCRWSFGDVKDPWTHRFCGLPKEKGSYCAEHGALAYAGLPQKKRK